ncbi:WD repeat domain-containing protein [Truncatella angustata]|uniref:Probable cytosolic iron-sulfur protein assembly protein 1 n=1 Tax=Truncatella angustata TaxID=152316 RepID=A0A9P9A1B1_9PEZI|nr:WD repeat domain-containing protein [Truncatella angustata]KAH6656840.1 WD repeat domain-containing protein [Truncatella angustata]
MATTDPENTAPSSRLTLAALPPFKPDLYERAWTSIPHPTLPLIATAHEKAVTVFSLSTLTSHSTLTGGHTRSVRSVAWKPNLGPQKLCLVTGSFDSTAGLWRWEGPSDSGPALETEVTASRPAGSDDGDEGDKDWEFTLVLEGHDSEVKSVVFSPTGQYLATCSRDKSVWIWEDVGATEADDEWETVAVLNEHEGDVKAVAWCPETNRGGRGRYSSDVLASASYDDTVRIWREDGDGEWVCVAVLEGHEGTVWGVQWEQKPRDGRFPRLMTWSADRSIRVWTLNEESDEHDEQDRPQHAWGGLGGIPNTMRRSLKEDWSCTAVLPKAHTRDIYSVSWSADSGLVASTGSDGILAVYREDRNVPGGEAHATTAEAAAELDGDVHMTNGNTLGGGSGGAEGSKAWRIVATTSNAHGPYEINHVAWCKRYDAACPPHRKGIEEMLVTTGDDGIVRPWQISS